MEIGSLNLLEPSGPHRTCCGTSLPSFTLFSTIQSDKAKGDKENRKMKKNEDDPVRREFIICIFKKH